MLSGRRLIDALKLTLEKADVRGEQIEATPRNHDLGSLHTDHDLPKTFDSNTEILAATLCQTMKIREIRCAGLCGATPAGGWSNELRPEDCVHTLILVHTDEGLFGLGSVFNNDQLVRAALAVLEPLYHGENASEPDRVSEKLHQNTFWLGRGGAITHTISGIDIALWDLLGQATQQPVGRLLGGRYREKVMPYASVLMEAPEALTPKLESIRGRGFRAFKIGWGPFGRKSYRVDEAIVKAAREAVGPDCRLMVDAGASDAFWPNGLQWACRTAEMLAAYDVAWFEEPLHPDALRDYVELRRRSRVPIAGGEVLTRRQAFQPWLQAGAFDIVQPDVTKVGGISEERLIAWMARDHGVKMIPHGWNTAVGLAADLQLASAFPETDLVEYLNGSPFIDGIVAEPWRLDEDGLLPIGVRPGLGLTLNREAVRKFTRGERLWLD
jgi:D-galactarolactone cycloisomerase